MTVTGLMSRNVDEDDDNKQPGFVGYAVDSSYESLLVQTWHSLQCRDR